MGTGSRAWAVVCGDGRGQGEDNREASSAGYYRVVSSAVVVAIVALVASWAILVNGASAATLDLSTFTVSSIASPGANEPFALSGSVDANGGTVASRPVRTPASTC